MFDNGNFTCLMNTTDLKTEGDLCVRNNEVSKREEIEHENEMLDASSESSEEYRNGEIDLLNDEPTGDETVLFEGAVTGVKLIRTVPMRISCFVAKKFSTKEKTEKKEYGKTEVGKGGQHRELISKRIRIKAVTGAMKRSDEEECDYDGTLLRRGNGGNYVYNKCDESFSSAKHGETHVRTCRIPLESSIFADQGVRMAKHLIAGRTIIIHSMAHDNPTFYSIFLTDEVMEKTKFRPYWVVRPSNRGIKGFNFTGYFR